MKKTIETKILICANSKDVWDILSNFDQYSGWNPFIKSIKGSFEKGNTVKVVLTPPGGGSFTIKPLILNSNYPELRWKGKLFHEKLFVGEHFFRVEEVSHEMTRFVHGENFSGVLVGVLGTILEKTTEGFIQMNEALKKKIER